MDPKIQLTFAAFFFKFFRENNSNHAKNGFHFCDIYKEEPIANKLDYRPQNNCLLGQNEVTRPGC